MSSVFQDVGQAIKAGDLRLYWIDVSRPGFLAREDLPPVELPPPCALPKAATPREETASSHLSLKAEIDQFHLEEEEEVQKGLLEILDSKGELDRAFVACSPKLIVARVDSNSEEDEEMDLNLKRGAKDLLTGRNKGSSTKEASKSQVLTNLPLPPLPNNLIWLAFQS